jgi:hypothetical protein
MPLRNGWGCRTVQTASHIHVIQIWGVLSPSTVEDRHMDAYLLRYHHRRSPGLGELAEILGDVNVQTKPLRHGWDCRTFQTASHILVIQIWGVWAPSTVVYRHMAAHSLRYYHRRCPRYGESLAESLGDVSVQTVPLRNGWGCRTFQTAYHIHVIPI